MAIETPGCPREPHTAPASRPGPRVWRSGSWHRTHGRRWPAGVAALAAVLMLWVVAAPTSPAPFLLLGPGGAPSAVLVEQWPYAVTQLVLAAVATVVALSLTAAWAMSLPWWGRALVGAAGAYASTVVAQALAPLTWLETRWFAVLLLVASVAAAVARRRLLLMATWTAVTVLATALALVAPLLGEPVLLWLFPVEIQLWQTVISGFALVSGAAVTMVWAVRNAGLPLRLGARATAVAAVSGLALVLVCLVVAAYAWRDAFPAGTTMAVFRAHPATAVHALLLAGLAHLAARSATGRPVAVAWLVVPLLAAGTVLFVSLSLLGGLMSVLLLAYRLPVGTAVDPAAGIPAEAGLAVAATVFLLTALVAARRRRTTAALTAAAAAAYLAGPGLQAVLSPVPVPVAANAVEVALAVTAVGLVLVVLGRGDAATPATVSVTVAVVSLGSLVLSDGWFADRSLLRAALAVSLFVAVLQVASRRRPVVARPLVAGALLGLGWLVLGLEPGSGEPAPQHGYLLLLGFPLGVAAAAVMLGRRPWEPVPVGQPGAVRGTP